MTSDLEFTVLHQEAMCDEDVPAVFQYFTKVSPPPVPPSCLALLCFWFLGLRLFCLGRRL